VAYWYGWHAAGRTHTSVINMPTFFLDKTPVTNDEYAAFLKHSS
jgi:formylglycine-generating enzyme required for sulfatase activity